MAPRVEWSFFLAAEDHRQVKSLLSFARSRFTPWGQTILAAGLFSLGIASEGTQIAGYFLSSFILALLITAFVLTRFFLPRVEARRMLTVPVAGGALVYKVIVKNTGRRVIRNLSLHEQTLPYGLYILPTHPAYKNSADWLEPGEKTVLTLALRTPRRGTFELAPLLACSDFPSGVVCGTRKTGGRARLVVHPRLIAPPPMLIGQRRTYQRGGICESTKVGDSNEFVSTRDYRHGDRRRDIHWASTARTGRLIVKEYVEEYFVRVGFFIDEELGRFEKHRCFEARISLCAGMCRALTGRDTIIDIFSSGNPAHIQSGRGHFNFDQVLEFLSGIEGETRIDFRQNLNRLKEYARELSQLVVFLKDWDTERAGFVRGLRQAGLNVKPVIIRDKKTTLPVDDAATVVYSTKELGVNNKMSPGHHGTKSPGVAS